MAQTHSLTLASASSQYLEVADHADFDLSTFTIEAWVKLTSIPTEFHIAGKWRTTGSQRSYRFMIQDSGATLRLDTSTAGSAESNATVAIGYTLRTGVWYHLAVSKTGTTTKFYINGKEYTAGGTTESTLYDGTAPFRIGANGNASPSGFINGIVKDVRLFNDVRTQAEIIADSHAQNVSDANLKAEYNLNNAYTDSSGNSHTLTASGSPTFSTDIPWEDAPDISGSTYLETNLVSFYPLNESSGNASDSKGSNTLTNVGVSYATGILGNGADFELGDSTDSLSILDATQSGLDFSGAFSISAWVKPESAPSGGAKYAICGKFQSGVNEAYQLSYRDSTGMKICLDVIGTGSQQYLWTKDLGTATWHHIVVVFQGTGTGDAECFVDGISLGVVAGAVTAITDSTVPFAIGNDSALSGAPFDGMIDEVGLWSRDLHYGDVLELNNEGVGISFSNSVSITVDSSVLSATFSIPSTTITAVQNVTVSPSVLSATFSTPTPSVQTSVTVATSAIFATFSIPAYEIVTSDVYVSANALSATFSIPSSTATGEQNVTVSPSAVSATFSIPTVAITVTADESVASSVLAMTFSIPTPVVTATADISVSSSVLAMTFSIPTRETIISVDVSPSVLALTFSIPSSVITTVRFVTISPDSLVMTMSIPTHNITGDFWQEKFPTLSGSNWSNKF